jgi:hypothetical protein
LDPLTVVFVARNKSPPLGQIRRLERRIAVTQRGDLLTIIAWRLFFAVALCLAPEPASFLMAFCYTNMANTLPMQVGVTPIEAIVAAPLRTIWRGDPGQSERSSEFWLSPITVWDGERSWR